MAWQTSHCARTDTPELMLCCCWPKTIRRRRSSRPWAGTPCLPERSLPGSSFRLCCKTRPRTTMSLRIDFNELPRITARNCCNLLDSETRRSISRSSMWAGCWVISPSTTPVSGRHAGVPRPRRSAIIEGIAAQAAVMAIANAILLRSDRATGAGAGHGGTEDNGGAAPRSCRGHDLRGSHLRACSNRWGILLVRSTDHSRMMLQTLARGSPGGRDRRLARVRRPPHGSASRSLPSAEAGREVIATRKTVVIDYAQTAMPKPQGVP